MSKYQKSIIYKIFDNTNCDVYYGSTYNLLRVRMKGHRDGAKYGGACVSKQIILNGNYSYSMVEPYPCNSKQELHTRERYWIENFDCINKFVPTRTDKEYYQDNKNKIKEQRVINKKEIDNKQAEYRAKNKEKINKRAKEFYSKNKERLKEQNVNRKEKIVCECGSEITQGSITRHRKSAKHIKLLALVCPPCIE